MSLNSAIESALPFLRAEAESRMTDQCLITTPSPPDAEPVWNPTTGQYETPPPTEVYGPNVAPHFGKCRLAASTSAPSPTASGPETWLVRDLVLHLPVSGTGEVGGTEQTCELVAAAFDDGLVGRRFSFLGALSDSQATARRIRVQEITG